MSFLKTAALLGAVLFGQTASAFDSRVDAIASALPDYYRLYQGGGQLESFDLEEIAQALADEISALPPAEFNDLVTSIVSDYRHQPGAKRASEFLLQAVRVKILPELRAQGAQHAGWIILNDVLSIAATVQSYRFGVRVWAARAKNLEKERKLAVFFRDMADWTTRNLPQSRKLLRGASTVGVLTHAVVATLTEKKIDPRRLLQAEQKEILHYLERWAVGRKTELSSPSFRPKKAQLEKISTELSNILQELTRLESASPPVKKSATARVRVVVIECQLLVSKIQGK